MDGVGVSFSCNGAPRGKGRPRLSTRGGFARAYTDPLTVAYEKSIAEIAKAAMGGGDPYTGALSVSLRFRLPVPASMSKRQRARILAGEEAYYGRIDLDNMIKAVWDSLNGIVFGDDSQVVRLFATKEAHATPGVDVKVMALEPQNGPA